MNGELQQKLKRLEELILEERDCARNLEVDRLKQLQEEKGDLVKQLHGEKSGCPDELKDQIRRVQRENIRNARLLHTCLGNLRQMMRHCTRQLVPGGYGQQGNSIQTAPSGLLLNGRI